MLPFILVLLLGWLISVLTCAVSLFSAVVEFFLSMSAGQTRSDQARPLSENRLDHHRALSTCLPAYKIKKRSGFDFLAVSKPQKLLVILIKTRNYSVSAAVVFRGVPGLQKVSALPLSLLVLVHLVFIKDMGEFGRVKMFFFKKKFKFR
jgi:hypothetical protein